MKDAGTCRFVAVEVVAVVDGKDFAAVAVVEDGDVSSGFHGLPVTRRWLNSDTRFAFAVSGEHIQ